MRAKPDDGRRQRAWKEREILLFLQQNGSSTLSQIREQFPGDSRQMLHIALKRLVRKGIIQEVRDGDRYMYQAKPLQSWMDKIRNLNPSLVLAKLLSFGLVTEHDLDEVAKLSRVSKKDKQGS